MSRSCCLQGLVFEIMELCADLAIPTTPPPLLNLEAGTTTSFEPHPSAQPLGPHSSLQQGGLRGESRGEDEDFEEEAGDSLPEPTDSFPGLAPKRGAPPAS